MYRMTRQIQQDDQETLKQYTRNCNRAVQFHQNPYSAQTSDTAAPVQNQFNEETLLTTFAHLTRYQTNINTAYDTLYFLQKKLETIETIQKIQQSWKFRIACILGLLTFSGTMILTIGLLSHQIHLPQNSFLDLPQGWGFTIPLKPIVIASICLIFVFGGNKIRKNFSPLTCNAKNARLKVEKQFSKMNCEQNCQDVKDFLHQFTPILLFMSTQAKDARSEYETPQLNAQSRKVRTQFLDLAETLTYCHDVCDLSRFVSQVKPKTRIFAEENITYARPFIQLSHLLQVVANTFEEHGGGQAWQTLTQVQTKHYLLYVMQDTLNTCIIKREAELRANAQNPTEKNIHLLPLTHPQESQQEAPNSWNPSHPYSATPTRVSPSLPASPLFESDQWNELLQQLDQQEEQEQ